MTVGAPRLHPREGGTVVDGPWIAAEYGKNATDIYAMVRAGVFPPPIGDVLERGVNPQNWRWSRARVLSFFEGIAA